MILGHLCFGRRVQISGYSDFRIFNNDEESSILIWVQTDLAFPACHTHPDNLDMTSTTFAAVICHADDPCSENTVYDLE